MSTSLQERFNSKYRVSNGGCWEWTASTTNSGYGRIREAGLGSKTLLAHRVSWHLAGKTIPRGMQLCHRCDNRKCVNPSHLFLGTALDNARDRDSKKRGADQRGESNGYHKLSNSLVLQIRLARQNGERYVDIASTFGIPRSTVFNACNHTWKHI